MPICAICIWLCHPIVSLRLNRRITAWRSSRCAGFSKQIFARRPSLISRRCCRRLTWRMNHRYADSVEERSDALMSDQPQNDQDEDPLRPSQAEGERETVEQDLN